MGKHKSATGLEEQARACEYDALFAFDTLRPQLLEHMPVLDEAKYARSLAPAAAVDMSTESAAAQVRLHLLCNASAPEHMPVLDKAKYTRTLAPAAAVDMSTESAAAQVRLQLMCIASAAEHAHVPMLDEASMRAAWPLQPLWAYSQSLRLLRCAAS